MTINCVYENNTNLLVGMRILPIIHLISKLTKTHPCFDKNTMIELCASRKNGSTSIIQLSKHLYNLLYLTF